jgi:hypothetical protein
MWPHNALFVGNKSDHFIYHQLGTGVGSNRSTVSLLGGLARSYSAFGGGGRGRNLPQRKMIGVNDHVKTLVRNIIKVGVDTRIRAANG